MKHLVFRTIAQAKRLIVIVNGSTVLAAGIAMIVLPGPAVAVIPIGLAEFIWASRPLGTVKEKIDHMKKGNECQIKQ